MCLQGTTHLHVKCQYFSIQPCKQADKRNKIALPPGTCPPSEDGKKYYWSARCGEYSLCCTWLQSVGARLADLIRLATNSLRTPRNFTERQWSVVSAMKLHWAWGVEGFFLYNAMQLAELHHECKV